MKGVNCVQRSTLRSKTPANVPFSAMVVIGSLCRSSVTKNYLNVGEELLDKGCVPSGTVAAASHWVV